ncbi:uncharacterized LOC128125818 homolog [Colius striatus]|uniref:uncharacterized LOC128125818 homolog n=1 Tax=Colius striatus TaxID=57412 RepID=UPI002B1CE812|nr:uncharacterized LOC128125818 homolog [Colius striatus]
MTVRSLHTGVMEFIFLVLYFSFFICLCTLVCLYFSGCQEMTYKHEDIKIMTVEDLIYCLLGHWDFQTVLLVTKRT